MRRAAIDHRYEIDESGRIFSLTRYIRFKDKRGGWHWRLWPGRELSQQIDDAGYPMATIDGKRFRVHRMVAEKFLPNPDALPVVNHIDGNPANNHVSNLEWTTQQGNLRHALEIGLTRPKTSITQTQIDRANELCDRGVSQREAARQVGMSQPHLSVIRRGIYEPKYATRAP